MSVRTSSGVSTCDVHSDDPQYYTIFTTIDVCEKGDVFSPWRSNFDIIMHMVSLRGSPVYIGEYTLCDSLESRTHLRPKAPTLTGVGYVWNFAVERDDVYENTGDRGTMGPVGYLIDDLNKTPLVSGSLIITKGIGKNIEFMRHEKL